MNIISTDCVQVFCITAFGETDERPIEGGPIRKMPSVSSINETECKTLKYLTNATASIIIQPSSNYGLEIEVYYMRRQTMFNMFDVSVHVIFSTEKYYREDVQVRFKVTRHRDAWLSLEQSIGKGINQYFPKNVFEQGVFYVNGAIESFQCYVKSRHNFSDTTYYVSVMEELVQQSMTESFEFKFGDENQVQTTSPKKKRKLLTAGIYVLIAVAIIVCFVALITYYIIRREIVSSNLMNRRRFILKRAEIQPVVQKTRIK